MFIGNKAAPLVGRVFLRLDWILSHFLLTFALISIPGTENLPDKNSKGKELGLLFQVFRIQINSSMFSSSPVQPYPAIMTYKGVVRALPKNQFA